jgi:guanylate cyclase
VWGDTVNSASRMESHSLPGRVQLSDATAKLVSDCFELEDRGMIEIKGKGPMRTWLVVGPKEATP